MTRIGIVFVALVLAAVSALAQVSVDAGGGLGIMTPTSDFGGSTIDHYAGQAYGFSTGFALRGKLRVGISGFTLVSEIGFASVNNSGNSEPGQGTVEVSQSILTFRAGPEFHITIPKAPLTPYIGGNLALHRLSGETTFQGVAKVPSATYSVEAASRFGIGFTGGMIISITPSTSLDLGLGYNLMNLGGKSWTDVNSTQDERLDSYLALNDAKDPLFEISDDKHFVGDNRSISSFEAIISVMVRL